MDWIKSVASIAPTIGLALGGPLGGLAGNFLAGVLGVEPGPGQTEAVEKIVTSGDPEMRLRIMQADQAFKVRLAELGIQEAAVHAQDRASAREREVRVGGNTTTLLAVMIIAGFLGVSVFVLSGAVNEIAVDPTLRGSVIGYIAGLAVQVVSYYFGSSAGQDHALSARGK